jgi:hypothetical protein
MFRTGRIARRARVASRWMSEARLPRDERRAARAERETLRRINLERDNPYSAERRADAQAGDRLSKSDSFGIGGGGW